MCYQCKRPGHLWRQCRSGKKKSYAAEMEEESDGTSTAHSETKAIAFTAVDAEQVDWVIDSGASEHMTHDRSMFTSLREFAGGWITLANGKRTRILGEGKVVLLGLDGDGNVVKIEMSEVKFVPGLLTNLISVSRLARKGLKVIFNNGGCQIVDPVGRVRAIGGRRGSLYSLWQADASKKSSRVQHSEKRLGRKVEVISSGGGGELDNEELKKLERDEGITAQFTTSCSPQQNRFDELKNRAMTEKTTCETVLTATCPETDEIIVSSDTVFFEVSNRSSHVELPDADLPAAGTLIAEEENKQLRLPEDANRKEPVVNGGPSGGWLERCTPIDLQKQRNECKPVLAGCAVEEPGIYNRRPPGYTASGEEELVKQKDGSTTLLLVPLKAGEPSKSPDDQTKYRRSADGLMYFTRTAKLDIAVRAAIFGSKFKASNGAGCTAAKQTWYRTATRGTRANEIKQPLGSQERTGPATQQTSAQQRGTREEPVPWTANPVGPLKFGQFCGRLGLLE